MTRAPPETDHDTRPASAAGPTDWLGAFRSAASVLAVDPQMVLKKERQLASELRRIISGRSRIKPPPHDLRFRAAVWESSPYYRRVLQAYLAWRKALFDILASSRASERNKARAHFILMQITEAAAPTNNPLCSPGFRDRLISTRGRSLLQGARNLWHDLRHNHGLPSQTDKSAYRVGRDLALSPGRVIHRDAVCEVIHYAPSTAQVHDRPVLIVPPQINRYYIVDLTPEKSLVKFLVDSGVQVFLISWRNPDARHAHWNLDTYTGAVLTAIDVARDVAASDDVDLVGGCAGGMTSLAAAGYLRATGNDHKVHSQTLLVTAFDTAEPMLLTLFATPTMLRIAHRHAHRHGVIDGADMARVFAWLRPTDMVWLFFANNYLLGRKPPSLDLLFWNNDATRLPAGFHDDAVRLFQRNAFTHPDGFEVLGRRVNLRDLRTPSFMVAGHQDHLVPWRASYAGTRILGGGTRFVLGTSGHVQTMITPPHRRAARFYINEDYVHDPDEWLHHAGTRQGSWWLYWLEWLTEGEPPTRPAPTTLGSERHPPGDPAPGRYVFT